MLTERMNKMSITRKQIHSYQLKQRMYLPNIEIRIHAEKQVQDETIERIQQILKQVKTPVELIVNLPRILDTCYIKTGSKVKEEWLGEDVVLFYVSKKRHRFSLL